MALTNISKLMLDLVLEMNAVATLLFEKGIITEEELEVKENVLRDEFLGMIENEEVKEDLRHEK